MTLFSQLIVTGSANIVNPIPDMKRSILPLLVIAHALTLAHATAVAQTADPSEGNDAGATVHRLEMLALSNRGASVLPVKTVSAATNLFAPNLVCARDIRDEFSGQTLAPEWTWTDPNGDVLASLDSRAGYLRVSTNSANNNLNPDGNLNGPRLLRPLAASTGIIQTSVSVTTTYDFQGAGLLVWHNAANFAWLHRALGINGPGIYFAVAVSNVMTYTMVEATPNDVELQIAISDGTINGFWRSGPDPWQFVGGGVLTGSLSGGVNLIAASDAPNALADFAFFESQTCKAASNVTYLPAVAKADPAVRGVVTYNGLPAAGVEVLLRQYRPGDTSVAPITLATATTAINGGYRFENPPVTPEGYARYVLFRNPSTTADGRLIVFVSDDLPRTGGTPVATIEIGDIHLAAPFDPQYVLDVMTPVQFSWQVRDTSPDDDYRLALESPNNGAFFTSQRLGYVDSYVLPSRPGHFATAPEYYYWYVATNTRAGIGFSFSAGAVAFNN